MYTLSVNSNKGPLEVKWTHPIELAKYANLQSGFFLGDIQSYGIELLEGKFQNWNQTFWTLRHDKGMLDFPDGARILDIGAGMSVIDLLLYSYVPNSKFYLLDRTSDFTEEIGTILPKIAYATDYPFYHSWAPVIDAIVTSGFSTDRFTFLDIADKFPEDLDAVTSYLSWCFHYPKEAYWDKAYNSLKVGGKLILDVRTLNDRDVTGEISEQMKSVPVTWDMPYVGPHIDKYGAKGKRCMWIKQ